MNQLQAEYRSSKNPCLNNIGITLLEVLIATLIISVIVFPLFISYTSASRSNSSAEKAAASAYYAQGRLEEVVAMNFSDISVSSPQGTPVPALSDTVTIQGRTVNRNVYVDLYDGDGDAVPDADLKKITVTVDETSLDTLMADYPYDTF
ncbi:MAG: hypothetical protein IT393_02550 [Nitrospirae bacterium]|nr:hypothetical protein [Nitrospirota bacterium]